VVGRLRVRSVIMVRGSIRTNFNGFTLIVVYSSPGFRQRFRLEIAGGRPTGITGVARVGVAFGGRAGGWAEARPYAGGWRTRRSASLPGAKRGRAEARPYHERLAGQGICICA
jgi:hypothetical protein